MLLDQRPPWETIDESQPLLPQAEAAPPPPITTANATGSTGATGGTDTNPSIPTPGLTPTSITDTASPFTPPAKANDVTPSVSQPDSVMGISALPDGAGGSVTVPPISLAPATVVPPVVPLPATGPYPTSRTDMNGDGLADVGGFQLGAPSSPTDGTPSIPAGGAPASISPSATGAGVSASDLAPWELPSTPAAPGTFNASDNLISSEVLPGNDPRLTSAQAMADAALSKEANGPDRLALAKQYYDEMTAGADADYQHNLVDATNAAGAHGQLHSGQLTNRYGDLFSNLALQKENAKNTLITNALNGTIGDTRNLVSDTGNAATTAYNEGAANRNETRTERGYQQDLATQALLERIQQQQAEQAANQQAFNNALSLYGVGSANNPEQAYETAAQQATSEAGGQSADVGQLLALLAQRRASTPATTGGY